MRSSTTTSAPAANCASCAFSDATGRSRAGIFLVVMLATVSDCMRMLQWRPVPADRMGTTPVLRGVPMKPAPGRADRRGPGLVCALAFAILWPGAGTTGELAWGDVATPLRIVNLNPFRLLYGVPGSLGAHVMARGSSELIAPRWIWRHT